MSIQPGQVIQSHASMSERHDNMGMPTLHRLSKREVDNPINLVSRQEKHILKVMTYNIWEESSYWQERTNAVIQIIKSQSPDVACLLDVTKQCYDVFSRVLESTYIVFQVFTEEEKPSGIVLLCRRDTLELPDGSQPYYYDYATNGRIIGVELKVLSSGDYINVLCTKLDDYRDNDNVRLEQFKIANHVINKDLKIKNYILMGDFNIFSDNEPVAGAISSTRMVDAWVKMGCPPKVKYTFDGKKNKSTTDRTRLRASRIYYHGTRLNIKSMGFVGMGRISEDAPLPPSCHYGLVAWFQVGHRKEWE